MTISLPEWAKQERQAMKDGYQWVATYNPKTGKTDARKAVKGVVHFRRATGEVVTLWANLTPYERRMMRKQRMKDLQNVQVREFIKFQKIADAEIELAEWQEALKDLSYGMSHGSATYVLQQIERLTMTLQKLRGTYVKPPKEKVANVRHLRPNGDTWIMKGGQVKGVFTAEQKLRRDQRLMIEGLEYLQETAEHYADEVGTEARIEHYSRGEEVSE